MNEGKEDYSNKRIAEVFTRLISWTISICIFWFLGFQNLYQQHYLFNTVQIMVLYGEYNSFIGYFLWALDSISIWGFIFIIISLNVVSKAIEYFLKASLFNDNIVEKAWLGYLELKLKGSKFLKEAIEEEKAIVDNYKTPKYIIPLLKLFPFFLTLGFYLICFAALAIIWMAITTLLLGYPDFVNVNMYRIEG
tara:strand:- start:793 stop:1371 length:579 start_codon:yes stop_codon:yes gene_type:complete